MSRSSALTVEHAQPATHPPSTTWPTTPAPARARELRLAGIAVHANVSCVLGGLLTAWTFASAFLPETNPGLATATYWMAGVAGAGLVVASLLLHELGHAIAARRCGLDVMRITLTFGGGTSEILGAVRHARDELVIAAAGPITSLAAAFAAAVAHVVLIETAGAGVAATVAALLAVANLALAALNAVPGLPLDGGRMFRAALWAMTGRREAATGVAMLAGRRVGEGLIVMAVFSSAFGFTALALWAALLGLVLRESC